MPNFQPSFDAGRALSGAGAPGFVPASVEISGWKGMASNFNKHILRDEYTALQVNLNSTVYGEVQVRAGMRRVKFDEG